MTVGSIETEALTGVFAGLAETAVRHAVLRNYETLPNSVGARDVDVLVHPDDLERATRVISGVAKRLDASFAKAYRDDMIVQIILARRLGSGKIFQLKIDLLHNRQIYGVEFLSAEQMLAETHLHNGIPVVADTIRFLDKWLFNRFVGQPTDKKYNDDFAAIARTNREALTDLLAPTIGRERAGSELEEIAWCRASEMAPMPRKTRIGLLAKNAMRRGPTGLARVVRFAYHRASNYLSPKGIFLSVSGPDGSGKTTVIDLVIADLEVIFGADAIVYRHFRPTVLPRIAEVAKSAGAVEKVDTDYDRPHRSRPSGTAGSLARIAYYSIDYIGGYVRSVLPELVHRRVVLFDRYYYDMIADPFRSRISLPLPLLRMIGRILPKPAHAFFIQVDPDEIFRRKQELTHARIVELNHRYEDLARRGWLILVNNDGAPETAAAAIVDHIIAAQDSRAQRLLPGAPRP
ncbi:MAG: hypothetical protein KDK28_13950 [Maritimibacter sp.]|nr:hypothetical protein [Maritimibacter sp.]